MAGAGLEIISGIYKLISKKENLPRVGVGVGSPKRQVRRDFQTEKQNKPLTLRRAGFTAPPPPRIRH